MQRCPPPPRISIEGEGSGPRGWLNQRVLSILQSRKEARRISDWPRLKWLKCDLQMLVSEMSVPLYALGFIIVPNLLPIQKSAIHRVTQKMIASVVGPAWEKEALAKAVRVVRSCPKTIRRVFEHHARKFNKSALQPQCACHTAPCLPGTRTLIEGHVAYVPPLVPCGNRYARPNDPLPLKGSTVRAQLLPKTSQR